MNRTPTYEIGALQWQTSEKTADLFCFAPHPSTLSVDILDVKGRMIAQHKEQVGTGPQQITVPLPDIQPGEYNAWVHLGGLTAIRQFTVPKSATASGRLQEWIMRLF
ncbi:MAG: hypothetical protein GVY26_20415 [Bacteroidetes bacterium]|jgi:hypothetical protein|nr:hypothetical protein [Bacteroidota bacterium]